MNTGELATTISEATGLGPTKAREVVNAFITTIQGEVRKGQKVTLAGFGSFSSTKRKARTGRNPQTGETVKIPAKTVPKFAAGRVFKEVVSKQRKLEKLAKVKKTAAKKTTAKKTATKKKTAPKPKAKAAKVAKKAPAKKKAAKKKANNSTKRR